VLPLRPLRPLQRRIWHQHLRRCHSSLRLACTNRITGLHPHRSHHHFTPHKSLCTLHPHHSSSSICHITAFHSCLHSRSRSLQRHQRPLSTALTRRRRQCCSKSSVSHKSKLTNFHLQRGTLFLLSQVDPATKHFLVTHEYLLQRSQLGNLA
jgi:hypothetical protein